MAEPLYYHSNPSKESDKAQEELDRFLQLLHERSVFRLLNDSLDTAPQWCEVLIKQLNQPGALNGMQNAILMVMALGRIPPERLNLIVNALVEASQTAAEPSEEVSPPGVLGTIKALRDPKLWKTLQPIVHAFMQLAEALHETPMSPIKRNHTPNKRNNRD